MLESGKTSSVGSFTSCTDKTLPAKKALTADVDVCVWSWAAFRTAKIVGLVTPVRDPVQLEMG